MASSSVRMMLALGAMALSAAHQKIDQMLDEAVNTTVNTQKQAQDQQDEEGTNQDQHEACPELSWENATVRQ